MRWLSQPEALLSDFLHARGIEHKRGERYPTDYEEKSGRKWARYDLHFLGKDGGWIDVEVWGDSLSPMSGGRYAKTRALKEAWQRDRPNFLGISYKDCLSQKRLAQIVSGRRVHRVFFERQQSVVDLLVQRQGGRRLAHHLGQFASLVSNRLIGVNAVHQ